MYKQNQKPNTQKAFTLIEIMVAVSIFAMVMVVAIGAVLSIVSANKKAQAVNTVLTNLNFSLEAMLRDLRTGYDYSCAGVGDCPEGRNSITFYSTQTGSNVTYTLSGTAIAKSTGDNNGFLELTGSDVKIDRLMFYVTGTRKTADQDYAQPKVIIIVKGSYTTGGAVTEFNLQTMVSQRKIDI